MKKTINKKSINKDIRPSGLTRSQIISTFKPFDGRTRYGKVIKVTSKIIYHTFEILSVVVVASFIAALAILWMAQA